jgi:hypothetical protein
MVIRREVARTGWRGKSCRCSKSLTHLGQMLLVGLLRDMLARTRACDRHVMLDGYIHAMTDNIVMPDTSPDKYQSVKQ